MVLLVLVISGWIYTSYAPKSAFAASGGLTTQDYIDIEQNYARFYQAYDNSDATVWADTFADDGEFNGVKGRAALIKDRSVPPLKVRHVITQLLITPTAEGASASHYAFVFDPQVVPLKINSYSRYNDTLVKTAKGWRFKTKIRSSDTTIKPIAR
jgi:hypothetical protein